MPTRTPTHGACAWLVPLLLFACNKQSTAPTAEPAVATSETPEPPAQSPTPTVAVVETSDEPELTGTHRIVKPGEMRSGLYEQPEAAPSPSRSKDEIKKVIRAHLGEVRACYERGLMRQPDLAGTLRLTFAIAEGGAVDSTQTELGFPDEQVADCIAGIAKTFVFPPAPGHGVVVVSYPFVLKTSAS